MSGSLSLETSLISCLTHTNSFIRPKYFHSCELLWGMIIIISHDTDKLHFSSHFFLVCLFNLCHSLSLADYEFCFNLFWCCIYHTLWPMVSNFIFSHFMIFILIHNFFFHLSCVFPECLFSPHKNNISWW